jgi:hypothetical protein
MPDLIIGEDGSDEFNVDAAGAVVGGTNCLQMLMLV